MAKRKKRKTRKKQHLKLTIQYELAALLLMALSFISILQLGAVGKTMVSFFRFFFGEWYMLCLIGLIVYSGYLMWKREKPYMFHTKLNGIYLIVSAILLLSHVTLFKLLASQGAFQNPSVIFNTWELFWMEVNKEATNVDLGGGMIGAVLFALFHYLFDTVGTQIISFIVIVIGFILLTGKTLSGAFKKVISSIWNFFQDQWEAFKQDMKDWKESIQKNKEKRKAEKQARRENQQSKENTNASIIVNTPPQEEEPYIQEPIINTFAERAYQEEVIQEDLLADSPEEQTDIGDVVPITFTEVENKDYELPPLKLLTLPRKADQSGEYEQIHANAAKLERTFHSFGVKARVTEVHLGPAVTKYEVHPSEGVKVSKIVNLSDDLALALAAKDIRIEAPIPGKSAIGIEVPNSEVAVVSLREVLESSKNDKPDSKLMIAFGRDITGEAVCAELNKMPHLLVAGATGSGKSVCINGIITSILMRAKPHEVKLMMIDPKMVELNVYNGVPHLLAPVVTNPKKASQALMKVVSEMERRYDLFSHTGTRNIEGYNEYIKRINAEEQEKQPLLPFIVVIVDELADLMMVASSDVEDAITRLAQMARAAGIHLIIATQRPSVDVITGVIKANIPSRIAFAVSSQTDSRTILDMGGAEKLLGRGDMLFFPYGASKPVRVQGAFLSDEEVEEVVDFVIGQQKAQYQEEMIPDEIVEVTGAVEDELYHEAVELIVEMQTASVSMLQRRFRIGYTRAARLIDEMEARGVVGPYEGSKPRTVLVPKSSEEINMQ
ncbi:spore DNA translocase [Niallia circulans]|jgi:DNA segregation ATPase FtsK/SpoIIIE, S-DNA-T family|uniref:DNA translocase FtsK n=1 Tax=Niallia circulans TaxID=1397 RepID=UPI00077CA507|nr:DNA translocase FtsK [Niallia circulans]MDR4315528.1 DNA translocase FtsK [Niallia circulans]MED3837224.1 DNA translocase FtsK [Niallia circulans]MED4244294.1 DNA translocase FtsK [Niallia circulans]MED4248972.1 DNA translocase FtsK [Niallia circulans]MED5101902.1 DNA translocase FtsK [Niallia circulans]